MIGGRLYLNPDPGTARCSAVSEALHRLNSRPPSSLGRIPNISVARTDGINHYIWYRGLVITVSQGRRPALCSSAGMIARASQEEEAGTWPPGGADIRTSQYCTVIRA